MEDNIQRRFDDLLQQGSYLMEQLPRDEFGVEYSIRTEVIVPYQAWLSSAANLIHIIANPGSYFFDECTRIVTHNDMKQGIASHLVQKMYGVLKAAKEEWDCGLLRKIEYIVVAATFDDFLDHASSYHKGNKKTESSVLGSTVLEDTIKKIAKKHNMEPSGMSLEPLIDELANIGVFTLVKAKRIKGYAAVRNHALHAEWDKFDIRDVGELIKGTRELIEEFL